MQGTRRMARAAMVLGGLALMFACAESGAASQGGGSGRWTIQGNGQSGVIRVVYSDGSAATIAYRQSGDEGCLLFDGNTLCRTSVGCE